MKSLTPRQYVLLALCVCVLVVVPLHMQRTTPEKHDNSGNTEMLSRVTFTVPSIGLATVEAGCGVKCKARKHIRKIWKKIVGKAGATVSGTGLPYFGGVVTDTFICHNDLTVFTIAPVHGIGGPYGIWPVPNVTLYRNYNITTGRWVLGSAPGDGVCIICAGPVCMGFPVPLVFGPGMGTS